MAWHAVTSDLTSFSFYHDSDKQKGIGFLQTLKDPIYLKIVLITPGTYYVVIINISSQNNQRTWCSPLKYGRIFSKQKDSPEKTKTFLVKKSFWGDCSK